MRSPAVLVVGVLALSASCALADVRLARVLSDNMVVQRGQPARIWGTARPGETIRVNASWKAGAGEVLAQVVAAPDGTWRVDLPTPDAGGPYTITAIGDTSVTLKNVMVGEVWLCSGQSNMELPLRAAEAGEKAIEASADPSLRVFTVRRAVSLHELADVEGVWREAGPDSVRDFSAVGYLFARELRARLGVPVGVIASDWGGTPVEAWMSAPAIRATGEFGNELDAIDVLKDPVRRASLETDTNAAWWNAIDRKARPSMPAAWTGLGFDDHEWKAANVPGQFEGALASFDGIVYYRKEFTLPEASAGKGATLSLGPIDDRDDTWVNGVLVGSTREDGRWNEARKYAVPPGTLKAGANVVCVRVLDTGGLGGFGGRPEQVGLTVSGIEGPIPLAGEWRQRAGASMSALGPIGEISTVGPGTPTALYSGMIAPLNPLRIRGVLWYQGEANVDRPEQYSRLFPAMIRSWRESWGADMPFYFVQIAPYNYLGAYAQRDAVRRNVAELREAQRRTLSLPNTGMAVTSDIGNIADIHPRNKADVAARLAGMALAETYGVAPSAEVRSPDFSRLVTDGSRAIVEFSHATGLRAGKEGVRGFLVAGADKVFYVADAVIEGDRVVVTCPKVSKPVAVRFGWTSTAEACLFNGAGLPVPSFRSDDWGEEGVTYDQESELSRLRSKDPGFQPMFNGKDLSGWRQVNCAASTWGVRADAGQDPVITCTGVPTGFLRSEKQYQNFELECEWRHLTHGANSGMFMWADALPAKGVPYARGIEVQIIDGLEGDWYTSDGDVFPIWGATMKPENPGKAAGRAYPTGRWQNPSPMWNHYLVRCVDGNITLWMNGHEVTHGHEVVPRKGYICLESEGGPVEFKNIRVKELPGPTLSPEQVAMVADGYVPLYDGLGFDGWKYTDAHKGHWVAADSVIRYDGKGDDLWTARSYRNFTMIADWKWVDKPVDTPRPFILPDGTVKKDENGKDVMVTVPDAGDSGIYLRGSSKSQVNIWCWPIGSGEVYGYRTDSTMPPEVRAGVTPKVNADAKIGEWNRFEITMKGDLLTVVLNGRTVLENARLPGVAPEGPIALQHHESAIEFTNLFIRELPD